ncbi:MAG TPA: hypothetical protein O0W95_05960 [Methanocorpusculum sp.]|nr:hypothetical protein [Methanocorpusculum sp.]
MNISVNLFTEWYPADDLPTEEKLLKNALESGKAAIIVDAGLERKACGLTEDALNSGKVLFIKPKFWGTELVFTPARMGALEALGYLAADESEDAGTLFYQHCIDDTITLADKLWEKQCRFNENYTGLVMMDGEARLAMQSCFPDISIADKLLKYISKNERKLKTDIKEFEEKCSGNLSQFRKQVVSSHLSELSDAEYLERFSEDKKTLLESYKMLKSYVREMKSLPEMFNCVNYLLRGGSYRDIKGVCRLVDISEIEQNGWSLNPDNYV